jgi:CAAX prenyl protease-like protein
MIRRLVHHPVFPYAAPFVAYILLLSPNALHPHAVFALYPLMVFGVGLLLAYVWNRLPEFRLTRPLASVVLGLCGALLWIGLYPWLGRTDPDPNAGFNPRLFEDTGIQIGLIAFRLLGSVIVVPLMEEIFWRGFLQRMLVRHEFEEVELGTYTHLSFWGTTGMFVLAHADQWGVALLWGAMAGYWFIRTRALGDIILLHAVTNLALGIYVLATGRWYFW